ncbi:TerB family tellurite resistance protein [Maribacter polysaccharolyticus]|uniref:tellurite resistance TerB family protein n=1 Tax=Maribacter polysaccharolyticus TaxID=3020831 RepID=UPI00237F5823|nr:TerB family tellurite resistance protein [Maribacter polysaccharolyticus]MDE3742447.1 TerB family tellurite resistance protein [Maribacter polysaccharolyticus]
MPILDLYNHSEKRRNLAHFAAIASLAAVDGEVNAQEMRLLDNFAQKLNITEAEFKEVMKKSNKYPIEPQNSSEKRLERLFDLFKIIFADNEVDDDEMVLLKKYAIGLGYPSEKADRIIEKSIAIFSGRIDFDDYLYLVKK